MDLLAWREENLAKRQIKNDKKILSGALPSRRERGKFEKDLKKWFESVKHCLKKT